MANKNTNRIHRAARKSFKQGNSEYSVDVPSYKFHDDPHGTWEKRTIKNVPYVMKKKQKPFPTPEGSGHVFSMADQRRAFFGSRAKI
jgi:hypothetical protein